MILMGNVEGHRSNHVDVGPHADEDQGHHGKDSVIQQVQKAREASRRRGRAEHPAGGEHPQVEGEHEDEKNPHPPRRQGVGHRGEVGDDPIGQRPRPRSHPHTDVQANRGCDDQGCRQQDDRVRKPLQNDVEYPATPAEAPKGVRLTQVEPGDTTHRGGKSLIPGLIEPVGLLQLGAPRLEGLLQLIRIANRLCQPGSYLTDILADPRLQDAI